MLLTPKPLTTVGGKETPSRLPRPTKQLLNTPSPNQPANSTPQYGNSKIPRRRDAKALPPIPYNVDSLKPLPSSPDETPNSTPELVAKNAALRKKFTLSLKSKSMLIREAKDVKPDHNRSGSRKSLTPTSADYTYVKKLRESSVAGNGPTLRISEDADDILFGPLDSVWTNMTAKFKLKSSPTSSKHVSPNSMKHPSDQVFGFPIYFEDSPSETGSLTSIKVASHREKALAFLEGRDQDTQKTADSVTITEQTTTMDNNEPEKDCISSQHESSEGIREDISHYNGTSSNHERSSHGNTCNSATSSSSSPLLRPVDSCTLYARTAKQMPVTSNLKAVRKISNLRKTASSQVPGSICQGGKQIKLISLSEARKRHGLNRQAVKLDSTPNLTDSPHKGSLHQESPLARKGAAIKENPKDATSTRRRSKIPVYSLFTDMVHRRRQKKDKSKAPIRPTQVSPQKRAGGAAQKAAGNAAPPQNQVQKTPWTPQSSVRKAPMDRHREMMVHASHLRQDARLVASQMGGTSMKLELIRSLELFNDTVMNSANALAAAESARIASLQARMYWESTHRAVQNSQELLRRHVNQALRRTANSI